MNAPALMTTEQIGDVVVVRFQSQRYYDMDKIEQLSQALLQFVDELQGGKVLFNLSGITYFSSAAIGVLIRVAKRLAQRKIPLRLCALQPMVAEIMFLQRLHLVFDISPTEAEALRALQTA